MSNPNFGIGILALTPAGATATPMRVGIVQNVTLDISGDAIELFGEEQFAVDVGIGKRSVTGKGQCNAIGATLIQAATGGTIATGQLVPVVDEVVTVPTTPFAVAVAGGVLYKDNLGVISVDTGLPLARDTTATAANVYALDTATGTLTFHSSMTGKKFYCSYTKTDAANGQTITMANQPMGSVTMFSLVLMNNYKQRPLGIRLPQIVIGKLSFAFKPAAHTDFDFEFKAQVDASNNVAYINTSGV